jgi:hypothetical protein
MFRSRDLKMICGASFVLMLLAYEMSGICRENQRMGPPPPRQPQRGRTDERDGAARLPLRDEKPQKRAPSPLSNDASGSSSSSGSSNSSGSSSSDSGSSSFSGRA